MTQYLIKILILAIFSFIIIYFYYSNPAHIENFDGYIIYILIIGIIYGIYKFLQFHFSKKQANFSLLTILGLFLIHLLILAILFFYYNNFGLSSIKEGISLFFKIIFFSLLPIFIILTSLSFGKKCSSYLEFLKEETSIYKFIISIGIGFFLFVFFLEILGMLGLYNLYIVFIILAGMIAFSYKELLATFNSIGDYKIKIDIKEGNYLRLISSEFLFIISTLVLSISLISIVRPFPIGWDDLGVYMNYPHLMAEAGSIISLGGMHAWQAFTGIGYMFGSPTQAFFFNVVGGFLSFIILILIVKDLLKSKAKTFINIPLLIGTTFIVLPMIVFQQAKDMKLDAGLFFISIIAVYLLFKYYLKLNNKTYLEKVKGFVINKISDKGFYISNLFIILIIGILAGFAFSIKFTALLLISSLIGIIVFARIGIIGFLGFLAIFFAIFTKAGLWSMMNVVVNPTGIEGFETKFFIISGMIGIMLFTIGCLKNKGIIKKIFLELSIFILGVFIALSPWISKNLIESYPKVSIGSMLSGKTERFIADYTKLYTEEELLLIEEKKAQGRGIGESGTTTNEDFGRYFGYEEGVNNYIKLPWNLTMQTNQGGEFTDIGFLFLALLPVLLLFLPFRRKCLPFLIVLILILELLIFIKTDNKLINSSYISDFSEKTQVELFVGNDNIFKNKKFNKDIYDIEVKDYVSKEELLLSVTPENNINLLTRYVSSLFYKDLKEKVLNEDLGKEIVFIKNSLSDEDYELIKELRVLNNSFIKFDSSIDSIVKLEKLITKFELEKDRELIIKLWKNNRTLNQFFTDFFSQFNLPFGYSIILAIFLLPLIALLYFVKSKDKDEEFKIKLFKLNLVFATFYTFLWVISAFGIVWYGIVMYFSFLLTIAIGIYYISSYKEEDENKKIFFIKMFGSIIVFFIFIIYFINSVLPHSFNNLKSAGYIEYKIGKVNSVSSTYFYHKEYLKILFYTNIDENKRLDFLSNFILDDIKKAVKGIEKMDIYVIQSILNQISTQDKNPLLAKSAEKSLNNIYGNISNPSDEYKNTLGIYRIGTFLKYHISENNKRLLEDSLIFSYDTYIHNSNINKTVENFKKLGVGYLLVDLNAATIDKDERRNLTKRYENLLSTFTSEKLELIETDSICLKIALEDFNKSDKFSEDRTKFLEIAGVNYESYTEDGKEINRGVKLRSCHNRIIELINNDKIDENNYKYLRTIQNYIQKGKENERLPFLQKIVRQGYKVLFKIN